MQVSFYVLGARYLSSNAAPVNATNTTASEVSLSTTDPSAEAVLLFVCKLIQTVVKKSDYSLIVIDDQPQRLQQLDAQLWTFDATSFIPHELILDEAPTTAMLSAPVILVSSMPEGFDGVVLNLAAAALPLTANDSNQNSVRPERVLEIISPDETSKEQGRQKYRIYRDLGLELVHHNINQ
ncbi:DNA polymerase III subunit chi [Psychrobacter sp. FDAARGOS_221]|uniref:DNA polymerase III subunit chi n=1 Tax=Psychrobacter sp. FDAARGOS_221 TaxID=1975705 RepID=UPI000BB54805|nr:DNA polymerase III subunit chi [Psychrobacter sp. FDAARGOS_221]PNK60834.1 DNA polymerase III subunit chi [Psychrobacter sp. FDAARGOS_221]